MRIAQRHDGENQILIILFQSFQQRCFFFLKQIESELKLNWICVASCYLMQYRYMKTVFQIFFIQ